jgi:Ca2+-binding RTX toxin-like protein
VPAYLSGGNLIINGTNAADRVDVRAVTAGNVARIRVTQNGVVQDFSAAAVTGNVQFRGLGGDDRFTSTVARNVYADGGAGNDLLTSAGGNDTLLGGAGNDTLEGQGGGDNLRGGSGEDTLAGGDGNDALYGEAGNDVLGGEGGSDLLDGGAGYDMAWGGLGADRFVGVGGDFGLLFVAVRTRFGIAGGFGVQDRAGGDVVVS